MFDSRTMRRIVAGLVGMAALGACAHGSGRGAHAGSREARSGAAGAPAWEFGHGEDGPAYAFPAQSADWSGEPSCTRQNTSIHALLRCGR